MTSPFLSSISRSEKYCMRTYTPMLSGANKMYISILRDQFQTPDWEEFGEESLPSYFQQDLKMLRLEVKRLADLSHPYTIEEEKKLEFMIESILQARWLVDYLQSNKV